MTDHAYANWVAKKDLQSLLVITPTLFEHMILEAVNEVKFAAFQNDIDLERYDTGRVFGSACELRWRRDGEQFHTLLVGDISQPPASITVNHQQLPKEDFDYKRREYFLWGEWSNDIPQWIEASIPHVFDYPEPTTGCSTRCKIRYKLIAIEYVNRDSGEIEFYRFTGTQQEKYEPV